MAITQAGHNIQHFEMGQGPRYHVGSRSSGRTKLMRQALLWVLAGSLRESFFSVRVPLVRDWRVHVLTRSYQGLEDTDVHPDWTVAWLLQTGLA